MHRTFKYIGAAVGKCAGITGCEQAPDVIRAKLTHLEPYWTETIYCNSEATKLDSIGALEIFSHSLALSTYKIVQDDHKFISFGGDHSAAIGTWSGVAAHHKEFGLVWIDAHMDAHTPETSPSGNPHGMPVATLLGEGDSRLTSILNKKAKLKAENITLIGIRSYEPEEKALLTRLGVKVYEMDEVNQLSFNTCLKHALEDFHHRGLSYGISLDLDGLDPEAITSLGTPVEKGIRLNDLLDSFNLIDFSQFIGLEITEYNPTLDQNNYQDVQTIEAILDRIHLVNEEQKRKSSRVA